VATLRVVRVLSKGKDVATEVSNRFGDCDNKPRATLTADNDYCFVFRQIQRLLGGHYLGTCHFEGLSIINYSLAL
jgi:hypothetical protein